MSTAVPAGDTSLAYDLHAMAGRIERVTPGSASELALSALIQEAKAADPLAAVTVVASSSTVALSLRSALARAGPFAGVRFVELSRLIEMIGAPPAGGADGVGPRVPLSGAAMLAAARVALAEAPGLLQPVADHPATASSLVATYRTMRPAGPSALEALSAASTRARDVVGLVEADALEARDSPLRPAGSHSAGVGCP